MGFWGKLGSVFKGIGKVALKAAPIAASFIPGVGIPAAMGIGALTRGMSNKLSGGSFLGGALEGGLEGGIGGLSKAAIFGKLGKGINPSSGFWGKFGRGMMGAAMRRPISRGYGYPQYPYSTPPYFPQAQYARSQAPRMNQPTGLSPFAQGIANNSSRFLMGG